MAHVVSADRGRLLDFGVALGLNSAWLQYKPLKDPRSGIRVEAWHWDLRTFHLERLAAMVSAIPSPSSPRSP